MIIKGIVLTALAASAPVALFATQNPERQGPAAAGGIERVVESPESRAKLLRSKSDLQRARAEVKAARRDLSELRSKLEAALDRLDTHVTPTRNHERSCSPSRNRTLMSHYQWLRGQGHSARAKGTLTKVVDQVGKDANRLNSVAWDLMTDKRTAGKYDEVALAMTKRMEKVASGSNRRRLHHNHLDTIAFANFLNGNVDRAIKVQEEAIAKGGNSDDFRRRLRTYQAARLAMTEAARGVAASSATMMASKEEDEE